MDRNAFVELMIAELQRQQDADSFGPRALSADEVYRKLCYDFPSLSEDDIKTLTSAIESCLANEQATIWDSGAVQLPISLHSKLLENLEYLGGTSQAEEDKGFARSIGLLNAAVFLKLPAFLLLCRKKQLNRIFSDSRMPTLDEIDAAEESGITIGPVAEPANLSWAEIARRYRQFIFCGSPSSIFPALQGDGGSSGTASTQAGRTALQGGGHVADACKVIRSLGSIIHGPANGDGAVGPLPSGVRQRLLQGLESPDGLETLADYLQAKAQQHEEEGNDEAEADDGGVLASAAAAGGLMMGAAGVAPGSSMDPLIAAKDCWVHLSFLLRDLCVRSPELVVDGSFSALVAALTPQTPPDQLATPVGLPGAQPRAHEYLLLVCFASLSSSLLGRVHQQQQQQQQQQLSGASSSRPQSEAGTGAVDVAADSAAATTAAADSERQALALAHARTVRVTLAARGGLRVLMDKHRALEAATDICERTRSRRGSAGSGSGSEAEADAEAAVLLADIIALYLQAGSAAAAGGGANSRIDALHERLLTSRALPFLAQVLVRALEAHIARVTAPPSLPETEEGPAGRGAGGSPLSAVGARLLSELSVAALQSGQTAGFLLQFPGLLAAVLSLAAAEKERTKSASEKGAGNAGTGGDRDRADRSGLGVADLLPLCVGWLASVVSQPKAQAQAQAQALQLRDVFADVLALLSREVAACASGGEEEGVGEDDDEPVGEAGEGKGEEREGGRDSGGSDLGPTVGSASASASGVAPLAAKARVSAPRLSPSLGAGLSLLLAAPDALLLLGRGEGGAALRQWCGDVLRVVESAGAAAGTGTGAGVGLGAGSAPVRRGGGQRLDDIKRACKALQSLLEGRSNKTD